MSRSNSLLKNDLGSNYISRTYFVIYTCMNLYTHITSINVVLNPENSNQRPSMCKMFITQEITKLSRILHLVMLV